MPNQPVDGTVRRRISPTDISQYIRLQQCRRFLALRLKEHSGGRNILAEYGVVPEATGPLLTRSGASFEALVEAEAAIYGRVEKFNRPPGQSFTHNRELIELAQTLPPGEAVTLFQVRLQIEVAGWEMRGDLDILRLERTPAGRLNFLIADMKSSAGPKVEHRLQVAFYRVMVEAVFEQAGIEAGEKTIAILYRGPTGEAESLSAEDRAVLDAHQAAARLVFGLETAFLELIADPEAYLAEVENLVTGENSEAFRLWLAPLESSPFHLTGKCDSCLYNPFCMKYSAANDDLSLLPQLTQVDKEALRRNGVETVHELAHLKELNPPSLELTVAPGQEELNHRLATTWPVGPRLDELVHRAKRYRRYKGEAIDALTFIPSAGHGSLPYSDEKQNPNLIRVYLDAQQDYLKERVYLLGALVVASENGQESPARRRSIVRITPAPPDTQEQEAALFLDWIDQTLRAVVELAAPNANGEAKAPIHLIFYDKWSQQALLEGLARHLQGILGATPLYDFLTQLAAFDSPVVSYLENEIRELKNFPMVCQSLQAVAAYLRFDWREGTDYREIFREHLFDIWGKLDEAEREQGESPWYTNHARFSSMIPLEYAYAAWDELSGPLPGEQDTFTPYRTATLSLITGFQTRRLEAIEWITKDFRGNHLTEKTAFSLPDLANFEQKARTLAHALQEFVTIERHVELGAWKATRNLAPERRVLMGETLLVRYLESDQDQATTERNRDNQRRYTLGQQFRAEYKAANPNAKKVMLSAAQKAECDWSQDGLKFRLRLETAGVWCSAEEVLALSNLREGDTVIIFPRWTSDERLPPEQRTLNTPTPKQMLYGMRVSIERIILEPGKPGQDSIAFVEVTPQKSFGKAEGYVFPAIEKPLAPDQFYTLDPDVNNWYTYWNSQVAQGLSEIEDHPALGTNTLYNRLAYPSNQPLNQHETAKEGQARFMAGLQAFERLDLLHDFEESKQAYIGGHLADPVILVQGPPGTGKSYSTGFAVFARIQAALAANQDCRVVLACKTHAATDVLLENVLVVQRKLLDLAHLQPELFDHYFDRRLLEVPLYRVAGRKDQLDGITGLARDADKVKGDPTNRQTLLSTSWNVMAATPGGIYGMREKKGSIFTQQFADYLVLDEASQMNLPEACMAALVLKPSGQLIVVGDHRQMPPIIKHDWEGETRRTFQEYKSYQSLFETLMALQPAPPVIKFARSFRLHAAMAEFLRREIYSKDAIAYHSLKQDLLTAKHHAGPFLAAVLDPAYPLVVITHSEGQSQTRNSFEQTLIEPILESLANVYELDAQEGMGVVVPHRAQRAALQQMLARLKPAEEEGGFPVASAVDTVERFQGGERQVILVSATESDKDYLLQAGEFLYDPRRLTVAISRAKRKMILVAAQSIFTLFSPQEAAFANSQIWKNLLRHTCTVPLWQGEIEGQWVEVWGNQPLNQD
jgi:hypothetical protein